MTPKQQSDSALDDHVRQVAGDSKRTIHPTVSIRTAACNGTGLDRDLCITAIRPAGEMIGVASAGNGECYIK